MNLVGLIIAFIGGGCFGILLIALVSVNDRFEKKDK